MHYNRLWNWWCLTSGFCCQCYLATGTVFCPPSHKTYMSSNTVWSGRLHQHEEILLFSNRNVVVLSWVYRKNIARIRSLCSGNFKLWMLFITFLMFVWIWFMLCYNAYATIMIALFLVIYIYLFPPLAEIDLKFVKMACSTKEPVATCLSTYQSLCPSIYLSDFTYPSIQMSITVHAIGQRRPSDAGWNVRTVTWPARSFCCWSGIPLFHH